MVNVNVATTAFYTENNLANAMMEFRNATFGARIDTFVRGVRVVTTHLGHKKSVKRSSTWTARTHKFMWEEEGREVSVEEYFQRSKSIRQFFLRVIRCVLRGVKGYGITLQYPDMPLVNIGGGLKQNLVPAEVCQILPGQPFRGKLSDEHTAQMILHACKPPNVNARSIVGPGLTSLGFKDDADPLPGFGIKIGHQMAVVPGRLLKAPKVMYSRGPQQIDEERAAWNLRSARFAKGMTIDQAQFAVLIIKDGGRSEFQNTTDPDLLTTVQGFLEMCSKSGMRLQGNRPMAYIQADLPPKGREDPTRKAAISTIRNKIMTLPRPPRIMLVILSNGDKHIYAGIKHLCDVWLDVHTVCVHSEKIRRQAGQLQYFANVALKFNMKLGGVNHNLDQDSMIWLRQQPTMLVGKYYLISACFKIGIAYKNIGMDVTHPGPGSLKGTPSIAAIVASVDDELGQFPASLRIQETKKEVSIDPRDASGLTYVALYISDDYGSQGHDEGATRLLPEAT